VSDHYRLTTAAEGAVLSLPEPFTYPARVPDQFQVKVPFSSRTSSVRAAFTPPEVHRLIVDFERRNGEPARAPLLIASPGWERSDAAEVFHDLPMAAIRQQLSGVRYSRGTNYLWFFADRDVQRLNVYQSNDDGTKDVVGVIKHLRLLDSRRITVIVGKPGNPVIQ
jgi:hypothetical protein